MLYDQVTEQLISVEQTMAYSTGPLVRMALILAFLNGLLGCGGGGGSDEGGGGGGPGSGNPPTPVTVSLGDDRLLEEGSDGGTTLVEFEVTLDRGAPAEVTVDYMTSHITTEDNDLVLPAGTLRFASGETSAFITVEAAADTAFELNENFAVKLINPSSNATIGAGEAIGRLINDDPLQVVIDLVNLGNFNRTLGGISVEIDYNFFFDLSDLPFNELLLPYDIYYESDLHLPYPVASGTIRLLATETAHAGRIQFALPEALNGVAINGRFLVKFDWSELADGLPEAYLEVIADAAIEADDIDAGMVALSVADRAVFNEGALGESSDLVFTAALDETLENALVLTYETVDRTATSPQDFVATSGSVTIPAGETSAQFTIVVNGDDEVEGPIAEVFRVLLGTDSDLVVLDFPWAEGIIYDDEDDDIREISIGNVELTEGDSGRSDMAFVATLDEPAVAPVTFAFATRDDTAEAGSDYAETSAEATFLPGESELTIIVPIFGDEEAEDDERFFLEVIGTFDNGIGVRNGIGTIRTDDPISRIGVADTAIEEGDSGMSTMIFALTVSEPSDEPIAIGFATTDGTAIAGNDYAAVNSTLTIPRGITAGLIEVEVSGDTVVEDDETFELTITTTSSSVVLLDDTAIGTILNDDEATGWSGAELVHQASSSGFPNTAVLPQVSFGAGAERHVIFLKNFAIWHTISLAAGSWTNAEQIGAINSEAYAARLTADDAGRALVVAPGDFLEGISFTPANGWRSEALPLAVEVDLAPRLASAPAAGQSIAVWREPANTTNNNRRSVWAARFEAENGWQETGLVEQTDGETGIPEVAMNSNGNAIVVFWQYSGIGSIADVVAYAFEGGIWDGPRVLDDIVTEGADQPRIDMNGSGNAAVVWRQREPVVNGISVHSVFASLYDAATGDWSDPVLVEEDRDNQADAPDVAIDADGNVFVVWLQRAPNVSRQDLYGSRYDAASDAWSEPQLLELDNTAMGFPISEQQVVADDLGNAIVVWLQNDGTRQNLRTVRYSAEDGDWAPATFLEEMDAGDAYRPDFVIDRVSGDAMVVWFQQDGSNQDVWANRYRN